MSEIKSETNNIFQREDRKFSMQDTSLTKKIEAFSYYQEPFLRFSCNKRLQDTNIKLLDNFVSKFIGEITGKSNLSLQKDIHEFMAYIGTNPALSYQGVTSHGSLLWLFLIARCLQPKTLVESGIYRGSSLHCFRQAIPQANIFAFDLNLKPLLVKDSSIKIWEKDWSEVEICAESENDLCYFDDHINNGLRIRQAFERGFKNLIFDDAPFLGTVHKFKYPGVPTVPMILNCEEGDVLQWCHANQCLQYSFREKDAYGAKDLIEFAQPIPAHQEFTSRMVGVQYFVKLK